MRGRVGGVGLGERGEEAVLELGEVTARLEAVDKLLGVWWGCFVLCVVWGGGGGEGYTYI